VDRYAMGSKIKTARTALGKSALDVARQCGMPEMRIYALERGRARLGRDEAGALARSLGVEPWTLAPQWFTCPAERGES
jgi:transcriptional regulator with XRE-family HTH domain